MEEVSEYRRFGSGMVKLQAAETIQRYSDKRYWWQSVRRSAFWVDQE
ncbi:hypothetical protein [Neptuniibacter sp. QD37_11]